MVRSCSPSLLFAGKADETYMDGQSISPRSPLPPFVHRRRNSPSGAARADDRDASMANLGSRRRRKGGRLVSLFCSPLYLCGAGSWGKGLMHEGEQKRQSSPGRGSMIVLKWLRRLGAPSPFLSLRQADVLSDSAPLFHHQRPHLEENNEEIDELANDLSLLSPLPLSALLPSSSFSLGSEATLGSAPPVEEGPLPARAWIRRSSLSSPLPFLLPLGR